MKKVIHNNFGLFIFLILIFSSSIAANSVSMSSMVDDNTLIERNREIIIPQLTVIDHRLILFKKPSINQPGSGYPVIFLLHGASQYPFSWFIPINRWNQEQSTFTNIMLDAGFFIIAPSSGRPMRPGPHAWGSYIREFNESEDLQLFESLFQWLERQSNQFNLDQVYCCGFSSGGFMTSRLAKVYPERFEKVIIHSGTDADTISFTRFGPEFDCNSSIDYAKNHPPVLMIHGKQDRIVPFECGLHMFNQLQRNNIESSLLVDEQIGHIWISNFNDEIVDWINS